MAVAKPFGGRIGPMFFVNKNSDTILRNQGNGQRAGPYVSGLQTGEPKAWAPGVPIPANKDFWIQFPGATIGGTPSESKPVQFAIPNLFSRFTGGDTAKHKNFSIIKYNLRSNDPVETAGLFDKKQYFAFKENLDIANSANSALTQQIIEDAIILARRATDYEALNYLIPTMHDEEKIDTVSIVKNEPYFPSPRYAVTYRLFGPLYGQNTFLPNIDSVTNLLNEFIEANKISIEAYLKALHGVADAILKTSPAAGTTEASYYIAAMMIHDNPSNYLLPGCHSMAGMFWYFYTGKPPPDSSPDPRNEMKPLKCPNFQQNLKSTIAEKWKMANDNNPNFQMYYEQTYVKNELLPDSKVLMSAYRPGQRSGADTKGLIKSPFIPSTAPISPWRNYYSTKFISIKSISGQQNQGYSQKSFPLYSEKGINYGDLGDQINQEFRNPLETSLMEEIKKIEI